MTESLYFAGLSSSERAMEPSRRRHALAGSPVGPLGARGLVKSLGVHVDAATPSGMANSGW